MGSIFSSKDYTATVYLPIEIRKIILEYVYGNISIERLLPRIFNIDNISKSLLEWIYKHSSSNSNNLMYTFSNRDNNGLHLIDSRMIFGDQDLINYIIASEIKTSKYHRYEMVYINSRVDRQYISRSLYARAISEDYIDLCHRLIDEYSLIYSHRALGALKCFRVITENYITDMNKKGLHGSLDKYLGLINKIQKSKTRILNLICGTSETLD